MQFIVDEAVFARFPDLCVGVVVAELDNETPCPAAGALLAAAVAELPARLGAVGVREHPAVAAWRTAFQTQGVNPNKFNPSIEALAARVAKGGQLPSINPAVDLANAAALRFLVPAGCHDLGAIAGDLAVRFSRSGDRFTPMGAEGDQEEVASGEIVYADDLEVRTRRWIWRQGDRAKVTGASRHIFFPFDGFTGVTDATVRGARDWLAEQIQQLLGRPVQTGWVQRGNPAFGL